MSEQDVALDLNALAPAQVEIAYKDQKIKVTPPGLAEYSKIMALSEEMSKLGENATPEATIVIYGKLQQIIADCIPEFKEEKLNFAQILAIFKLLAELGTPRDSAVAELEKRGITINSSDKSPKDLASPQQ